MEETAFNRTPLHGTLDGQVIKGCTMSRFKWPHFFFPFLSGVYHPSFVSFPGNLNSSSNILSPSLFVEKATVGTPFQRENEFNYR